MTDKWTPGPYHIVVFSSNDPRPYIIGPAGERIAKTYRANFKADEIQANARLIAEAPALVEALAEFIRMDDESGLFLNSQDSHGSTLVVALAEARAVLARVRGERT